MRRMSAVLVVAIFVALPTAVQAGDPVMRGAATLAVQASVMLAFPSDLNTPFCAGVFAAPDKVLTAAHCIGTPSDPDGKPDQRSYNFVALTERGDAVIVVATLAMDKAKDTALLQLTAPVPYARVPTVDRDVARGDYVIQVGAPDTEGFMVTYGRIGKIVTAALEFCDAAAPRVPQQFLYIDAAGWHGSSGGGVFSPEGRLVGIVTGGAIIGICGQPPTGMLWTIAIGPDTVAGFLAKAGLLRWATTKANYRSQ